MVKEKWILHKWRSHNGNEKKVNGKSFILTFLNLVPGQKGNCPERLNSSLVVLGKPTDFSLFFQYFLKSLLVSKKTEVTLPLSEAIIHQQERFFSKTK